MNQDEIDFASLEADRPLFEHFDRLEALAKVEFSEENLCIAWVTDSDGCAWLDWWNARPGYERDGMLSDYRFEREAAARNSRAMTPYHVVAASHDAEAKREEELAHKWAEEIKLAAVERRPVPFMESERMTYMERLHFKCRLTRAFMIAGVVIIPAQPDETVKRLTRKK